MAPPDRGLRNRCIVPSRSAGTLRRLPFSHGKKAKTKSESALEIEFSGPVSGSGDLAAYQLSSVTTKKVKKKVGTTYEPIRLISALPASSPMTASVSLLPSTKPNLAQTDRLEIVAADLTDALGRPLDGNDDGQPGGDFAATFSRQGIAFGEPSNKLARAERRPVPGDRRTAKEDVIDVSLERGDLVGVKLALGTRRTDD